MQDFACHGNTWFPWVDPETSYRIFNVPEAPVKAFANKEQSYGRPNAVNQTRNVFQMGGQCGLLRGSNWSIVRVAHAFCDNIETTVYVNAWSVGWLFYVSM